MTQFIDDSKRRMLPRWRKSNNIEARKEASPLKSIIPKKRNHNAQQNSIVAIKNAWERNKGLAFANDLVAAALIIREPDTAVEAAQFILKAPEKTSKQAVRLAKKVLGYTNPELDSISSEYSHTHDLSRFEIHRLRNSLRQIPDNPIAWTDLSRHYLILGSHLKAERAMQTAISLAPNHRFTIRAASRLFHLLDNPEKALQLLRKTDLTTNDPWLVAAELAMSSIVEQPPQYVKKGREFLKSGNIAPFHLSELAASLGSLDFENGKDRQGRKKFQQALQQPTENVIAQAAWANRHLLKVGDIEQYLTAPNAHEALAWNKYKNKEWSQALQETNLWISDEPFSSRSVGFGGYIASVPLELYDQAIELFKIGLKTSPHNASFLNNIAYCYASQNNTLEALKYLNRASKYVTNKKTIITIIATEGLVAYRNNADEKGKEHYILAMEMAKAIGNKNLEFNALCFFAREELRIQSKLSQELINDVKKLAPDWMSADMEPIVKKLLSNRIII